MRVYLLMYINRRSVQIASIPLVNRSVVRFGEQLSQKVNKHGDFAGLGWVDGSYLLFVEPRLIGNLDVVSVRVADVCREVVGTPFGPKARFLVCSSSRVYRRLVAGPDSVRALGCECDVKVFGDFAILQPETRMAIDRETVQLIELVGHVDAKRLKHLLVKFPRPFHLTHRALNIPHHAIPLSVLTVTARRIRV